MWSWAKSRPKENEKSGNVLNYENYERFSQSLTNKRKAPTILSLSI